MARTYTTVGWEDGTILQPATVTVQGTQYNVEPQVVSGTTPINATNLRKMDNEIKRVVEEDIPSVLDVVLIAVTDTAPSECAKDDKYYNTTDNKIYTATATNTWSLDGDYPVEGIMYILFGTQSSYAYNGTALVSVGGGSGDLIIVGDDSDITENTKLLIEEDDLNVDASGTYITNEYSESTTLGYSCSYLDGRIISSSGSNFTAFGDGTVIIYGITDSIGFSTTGNKEFTIDISQYNLSSLKMVNLTLMVNYNDYTNGKFYCYNKTNTNSTITGVIHNEYPSNIGFYVNYIIVGKIG